MSLIDWLIIGLGALAVVLYAIAQFKKPKTDKKKEEVDNTDHDAIETK